MVKSTVKIFLLYLRKLYIKINKNKNRPQTSVVKHNYEKFTYPFSNIYHCCTQKTASQWFQNIFNDEIFYKYSGLNVYSYNDWRNFVNTNYFDVSESQLAISKRIYSGHNTPRELPQKTIATPMYIGYKTFDSINKPVKYKCFFILRDPRDIVISWYFSTLYSHSATGAIPDFRRDLENLSLEEGLKYSIDSINYFGMFMGQKSWKNISKFDDNVTIFRYEELSNDNELFLNNLLEFLEIDIPKRSLKLLFNNHKFEHYSKGRKIGTEDIQSHYRKGISGDWKNYFSPDVNTYFNKITGNLLNILEY